MCIPTALSRCEGEKERRKKKRNNKTGSWEDKVVWEESKRKQQVWI